MENGSARIVPVKLPNGAIVHVEAETLADASSPPPRVHIEMDVSDRSPRLDRDESQPFSLVHPRMDVSDRTPPISQQDMQSVMGTIEGIAQAVTTSAERSNAYEINVEFGLKLAIENGQLTSLFVKGSGEANLKVALKWARQDKATETSKPASTGGPGGSNE